MCFVVFVFHYVRFTSDCTCISFPRQFFAIVLYHVNNLWSILLCRFQTVCYIHGDIKKYPTLFSLTKKIIMLYMIFQSSSLNHYQNQSYCIYNVSYITLRRLGNQLISHKVFLKFLEMISSAMRLLFSKTKIYIFYIWNLDIFLYSYKDLSI